MCLSRRAYAAHRDVSDPAKQRGQHARQMGAGTAAGTAQAAATKLVPHVATNAVAETLFDAVIDAGTAEKTGSDPCFFHAIPDWARHP